MNLADSISLHARLRPSAGAIEHRDRIITYAEFDAAIDAVAARLMAQGVRAGEPVGLCLQDHPLHLAALFAVLRLSSIVLPMDWRWTPAEQVKIATKYKPRIVLVEPSRPSAPDIASVPIDRSWESPAGSVKVPKVTDADAPAILGLSSGTTGEPKAVVTTHAQYHARLASFTKACRLTPDDRYCSTLPLVFSAGRLFAMTNLVAGATVVLAPSFSSAAEIAETIVKTKATTTCLVPSVSRQMLKLRAGGGHLFPDLRVLISAGAPLHDGDRAAIRERLCPNLVDVYASTGGSLASAIWPDEQRSHPGSVGRPAEGVEFQVVDESDTPLQPGTIGRVRYRGPGFPLGFYGGIAAGDEDIKDGWFYPGDFASIDSDGYIHLQGRRSEIVIRGGINVFTPEIERALLAHPSITEAAVVGVPSSESGEDLVAFVRCQSQLETRELIRHCRSLLAGYKIPTRFHFLDALPKNAAGKVLKAELVRMDASHPASWR